MPTYVGLSKATIRRIVEQYTGNGNEDLVGKIFDWDMPGRIRDGMAWLTEVNPGWRVDVNPAGLRMASCTECVIGQLAGAVDPKAGYATVIALTFEHGPLIDELDDDVKHELWPMRMTGDEAAARGFSLAEFDEPGSMAMSVAYQVLTAQWRLALNNIPA